MPPPKITSFRANKQGPINPSLFNLLENLLIFRTMPELSVPPESSVRFRISRQEGEPGICLLIHIDDQKFPVFAEGVLRPDYLALYLHGDLCLCTIVEMKSTAEKNLKHGLDQIKALADRLKAEFQKHLPRNFQLCIQGILLCQDTAQIPNPLIAKMSKNGLVIRAVPFSHRAELYPYVSKRHDLKARFKHEPQRRRHRSFIERMLSEDTLNKRLPDELTKKRGGEGAGQGLHVNFMLSEDGDYATLMTKDRKCVFVVREEGDHFKQELRADIAANGLGDKFIVEPMPVAEI